MADHAAFVRAINVGGRRVTNERLVALVTDAGLTGVSAYQAAGNILFEAGGLSEEESARRIADALGEGLGFPCVVFVRGAGALREVLAAVPFPPEAVAAAVTAPQVAFLSGVPPEEEVQRAEALGTDVDPLAVIGRELHWLPTAGVGRAALDLDALEGILGPFTLRTRGTVERIAARLDG